MVVTISPTECTEAHVFEHIQSLESQACEELGNEISFGTLPAPFDMRRTEEGLYDHQRDMKEDYLPAIHMALGIRHYLRRDSAQDVALAEANSLKWYYVAIRPKRDLFTVIKYRSPKPCHAFVLQMAGLTDAYHESHEGDVAYEVFVPCGTLETTDLYDAGLEPQESETVARRLISLAEDRGGKRVSIRPQEGGRKVYLESEGRAKELWIRMPADYKLDALLSRANPTAAQLAAELAVPASSLVPAACVKRSKSATTAPDPAPAPSVNASVKRSKSATTAPDPAPAPAPEEAPLAGAPASAARPKRGAKRGVVERVEPAPEPAPEPASSARSSRARR
jgi:hypothetical protein